MAATRKRAMADAISARDVRALVTPEGIDLRVNLAAVSERAIALVIDLLIICGILLALMLACFAAFAEAQIEETAVVIQIIWMLGFFILRNFYFTIFESGRRAATPGKRIMGLRVVARDGAALTADAVVARNVMREIELYLPLMMLLGSGSSTDVEAWMSLAGTVWCGIFVLLPLFNRDRLRAGDLIAGTWVLKIPKRALLPDLADENLTPAGQFIFTNDQLDVYGVKELQVLEQVLRAQDQNALIAVADRIRHKIDWRKATTEADVDFLQAYYAALRSRLEQRLLFGKRKRDKHDRT
jgi:uncharacterized RDD family membrane protein YckC